MRDRVSPARLFWFSLLFGARAFGGVAMVAYLRDEVVDRLGWLEPEEYSDFLALCQVIPGATLVEMLGLIGNRLAGPIGALTAAAGLLVAPFLLLLLLSWVYFSYGHLPIMTRLFSGLGAVVLAVMLNGLYQLWKSLAKGIYPRAVALIVLAINLHRPWPLSWLVVGLTLTGLASWKVSPGGSGNAIAGSSGRRPDDTAQGHAPLAAPKPRPLPLNWTHGVILMAFLLAFSAGLLSSTLRSLFWAFAPVGLIAFGGGMTMYALIQQVAVNTHLWLTLAEFRDGVALGQITPGPIMITAAFIGYKVQGLLGAVYATLGVFGPGPLLAIAARFLQARYLRHPVFKRITVTLVAGFLGYLGTIVWNLAPITLVSWQTVGLFLFSFYGLRFRRWDVLPLVATGTIISLILIR